MKGRHGKIVPLACSSRLKVLKMIYFVITSLSFYTFFANCICKLILIIHRQNITVANRKGVYPIKYISIEREFYCLSYTDSSPELANLDFSGFVTIISRHSERDIFSH